MATIEIYAVLITEASEECKGLFGLAGTRYPLRTEAPVRDVTGERQERGHQNSIDGSHKPYCLRTQQETGKNADG